MRYCKSIHQVLVLVVVCCRLDYVLIIHVWYCLIVMIFQRWSRGPKNFGEISVIALLWGVGWWVMATVCDDISGIVSIQIALIVQS